MKSTLKRWLNASFCLELWLGCPLVSCCRSRTQSDEYRLPRCLLPGCIDDAPYGCSCTRLGTHGRAYVPGWTRYLPHRSRTRAAMRGWRGKVGPQFGNFEAPWTCPRKPADIGCKVAPRLCSRLPTQLTAWIGYPRPFSLVARATFHSSWLWTSRRMDDWVNKGSNRPCWPKWRLKYSWTMKPTRQASILRFCSALSSWGYLAKWAWL